MCVKLPSLSVSLVSGLACPSDSLVGCWFTDKVTAYCFCVCHALINHRLGSRARVQGYLWQADDRQVPPHGTLAAGEAWYLEVDSGPADHRFV